MSAPSPHRPSAAWTPLSLDGFYSVSITAFSLVGGGAGTDPTVVGADAASFPLPTTGFNRPHTIVDSGTT